MLMPMLSFIKNSINLHLQRGDKVKSVHITSEDLEVIKKETLFYPIDEVEVEGC